MGDDLALEAAPPMIINGDDSGRCCHALAVWQWQPVSQGGLAGGLDRYCAVKEERHYSMVSGWAMVFRALNMKFLHLVRPFSTIRQRRVSKCVVIWSIIQHSAILTDTSTDKVTSEFGPMLTLQFENFSLNMYYICTSLRLNLFARHCRHILLTKL